MKCKHCGEEIANDSQFCEFCGARVASERMRQKKSLSIVWGVALVVCCVSTTLFFAIRYQKMAKELDKLKAPVSTDNFRSDNASPDDFKFDNVSGRSIPKAQMVFSGDTYEADIILASYNNKSNSEVYYKMGVDTLTEAGIAGATKLESENGLVKLKIRTGSTGEQKYAGLIKVTDPGGEAKYYGFKDKYTVLTPSGTIAADKMNVLYAGISNPVSVSGPVAPDKLSVSFPGCSALSQGAGKFVLNIPTSLIGMTVQATMAARIGESVKTVGATTFRVKRVPDPKAVLGANIRGGKRTKTDLLANPVLRATMGEDFVYDLKWTVTSFRVIIVSKGMEEPAVVCQGSSLNDKAKTAIQKASSNTVVCFTDIKATSQVGERTLEEFYVRIR